jgi:micrococcal nuclease
MVQYQAKGNMVLRTHLNVVKVVDGDGLIVRNLFNKEEEEIRLLGIDAPEIKRCRKLIQDEKETHLPGQLLMDLGILSFNKLKDLAPAGTNISLILQEKNQYDTYGRTLAYVFLSDGSCVNEIMLSEGFAKPYSRFNCTMQYEYQLLCRMAKMNKNGLFEFVPVF